MNATAAVKNAVISGALCVFAGGCASSSSGIRASYVSPLQYQSYSCDQLSMEAQRVSTRAAEAAGVQDEHATNDAVAVGIGAVIFWPSLFFMKGDGQTAAELGRLKGEFEAIEKAAIEKNCNLRFQRETTASLDRKAKP